MTSTDRTYRAARVIIAGLHDPAQHLAEAVELLELRDVPGVLEDDPLLGRRVEPIEPLPGRAGSRDELVGAGYHVNRHVEARHLGAEVHALQLRVHHRTHVDHRLELVHLVEGPVLVGAGAVDSRQPWMLKYSVFG